MDLNIPLKDAQEILVNTNIQRFFEVEVEGAGKQDMTTQTELTKQDLAYLEFKEKEYQQTIEMYQDGLIASPKSDKDRGSTVDHVPKEQANQNY